MHLGNFSSNMNFETCDYWLITSNQQTLCIETNVFNSRKLQNRGQLQINICNGAMLITINLGINEMI